MADTIVSLRRDILEHTGLDPSVIERPGCTVHPCEDRRASGVSSAYVFGPHLVVFAAPQHASALDRFDPGSFDPDTQSPLDRYIDFTAEHGAELLGRGVMRVLVEDPSPSAGPPDGLVRVDRDSAADVERLRAFIEACDPDEVDEAAIELDELDPVILCFEAMPGGPLIAYASAFPDDAFGGRWDIGVLTHVDHRRRGLGEAAVRQLVIELDGDGQVPIYRHERDNAASAALAARLGFEPATALAAVRFGTDATG